MGQTFEDVMNDQEKNDGKVQAEAVKTAQANMAAEKAEQEAKQAQRCLERANEEQERAAKQGREASKKKNILKKYAEDLSVAVEAFKIDGDVKKYQETADKLEDERDGAISKAHRDIYGTGW